VRQLCEHYHTSSDLISEEELRQYFLFFPNSKPLKQGLECNWSDVNPLKGPANKEVRELTATDTNAVANRSRNRALVDSVESVRRVAPSFLLRRPWLRSYLPFY
jgi:hypothetical protein